MSVDPLPKRQDDKPSTVITEEAKAKMRKPKSKYDRREFVVDDFRFVGDGLFIDRVTRGYLIASRIDKLIPPIDGMPASAWLKAQAKR